MAKATDICARELRHPVTVKRKASTVDSLGQQTSAYATVTTGKAKIETLLGKELEQARVLVPQATTRITMRYRREIDERCRIYFGDRIFEIGYINNVEQRNLKLILTCSESRSV